MDIAVPVTIAFGIDVIEFVLFYDIKVFIYINE